MSFEPQTAVDVIVIPIDACLETSPTQIEACLLACPDNVNMRIELLSVGFRCNTLPADGADVDVDIEWIDDSHTSDAASDLFENYSLKDATVYIYNSIWRGSQILDPGDVINAEFATDSDITTPSEGAALIVEYRVLMRS